MNFDFEGVEVRVGAPADFRIPVCTMASGHELTISLHVVPGTRRGQTILVAAGSHGEEVWSSEFVRRTRTWLEELDYDFAGTILLAPVLSPHSYELGIRNTPFDFHNLNRVFPGNEPGLGWYTEMIAHVIATSILPRADVVFDYHGGGADTVIRYHYTAAPTTDANRKVHEVALASGAQVLWEVNETRSTLTTHASTLGKLCIVPEVGGGGVADWEGSFGVALAELANMLTTLGIMEQPRDVRKARILVRRGSSVRPRHGGVFVPDVGADALGTSVEGGTLLGRVYSPHTFEFLDELRAPYPRTELMQVRTRVSRVHPGDYAYIVGDGESGYLIED